MGRRGPTLRSVISTRRARSARRAAAVVLAACGSDAGTVTEQPDLRGVHLTVGSTRMDDSILLAELYAQALESKGASVTRHNALSTRQDYSPLLVDGTLDLVPERSDRLLAWLTSPGTPTARSSTEQLDTLVTALPAGLAVLSPSAAEDKDGIACRKQVAADHELRTLSDLEHSATRIHVGRDGEHRACSVPCCRAVHPAARRRGRGRRDRGAHGRLRHHAHRRPPHRLAITSSPSTTISSSYPARSWFP